MKRRSALKSLSLLIGGTITLPAWAANWNHESLPLSGAALFTPEQESLLAELAETIIPGTTTPGAKELGVHRFIFKMLTDCYEISEQDRFIAGLTELENVIKAAYGKSFILLNKTDRLDVLQARETAAKLTPTEKNAFFPYLKNFIIQGYLSSEYVMKEVFKYELVPARYHGCVPVTASVKR